MRTDVSKNRADDVDGRIRGRRHLAPRRGYRATAEVLEGRQLLAVAIGEVPLPGPPGSAQALDIISGPDGNLWFDESTHKIGRITPTGAITEFPVPGDGQLGRLTVGSDGNVWFLSNPPQSSQEPLRVGRITPQGDVTLFDLPEFDTASAIATGPDGNLWVAEGYRIDRVTTAGAVTEFALPADVQATQIIPAPDGNLWFTTGNNQLGKITTTGAITIEPWIPSNATLFQDGFVVGPDGNFWLAAQVPDGRPVTRPHTFLIRITPDGGNYREFILANNALPFGVVNSLAVGSDGNLWLTASGLIVRFTLNGTTTTFTPPASQSGVGNITAGPDGNLWFTDDSAGRIGQVVLNAPEPATLDAQGAASVSQNNDPGGFYTAGPLATFTPLNPADTADDYAAKISWGYNLTSQGTVTADGLGGFRVDGLAPGTGTFHPVITIFDARLGSPGASAVVTTTVNVTRLSPQSLQSVEYRGTLSPFLVAWAYAPDNLSSHTATIDWGDGSTSAGTVSLNPVAPGPGWTVWVTGTHVYAVDGFYNVRTTITDGTGASSVAPSLIQYLTPFVTASHSVKVEGRPGVQTGANLPDSPTKPGVGPLSTVGVFSVAGLNVPESQYSATIDWGDGSGPTPGIITARGPDVFYVSGVHTFAKVGTYRFHVTFSGFGQTNVVTGVVHVTGASLGFSGVLDPASDSGYSHRDGITSDPTPRFYGAATPGTTVELLATSAGTGQPFSIGKTVVGPSGLWSLTSRTLPEGIYTIAANQAATDGRQRQGIAVQTGGPNGRLVVDTTGPRITGAVFDPATSKVTLTFEDNLSQVNPLGLLGRGSTLFGRVLPSGVNPIPSHVSSIRPGGGGVVLELGHSVPQGRYVLQIEAGSLRDAAGNALDGEFRGIFPTGDGHSGGNFLGRFVTSGQAAVSAQAVIAGPPQEQASRALAGFSSRKPG